AEMHDVQGEHVVSAGRAEVSSIAYRFARAGSAIRRSPNQARTGVQDHFDTVHVKLEHESKIASQNCNETEEVNETKPSKSQVEGLPTGLTNKSDSHKHHSQLKDLNHLQSSNELILAKIEECPLEDPQTGFKEEPEPVGEEPFESNTEGMSPQKKLSASKQDHHRSMYHGNLNGLATKGLATEHYPNYGEDVPMEVKQQMAPYWEKNPSGIRFRQIRSYATVNANVIPDSFKGKCIGKLLGVTRRCEDILPND
ncbi:hypothetical protein THAOC_09405, partial [Thalassiosira oceanica]